MTSEIVQSDIDLTRRMIDSRRPDREIIAILGKRGIDTDRAALLIDDLRYGRKVVPHLPLGYHIMPRGPAGGDWSEPEPRERPAAARRPATSKTAIATQPLEGVPDSPDSAFASPAWEATPEPVEATASHRRPSAFKWVAVVLGLTALGITLWTLRDRIIEPRPAAGIPRTTERPAEVRGSEPTAQSHASEFVMELNERGLHLAGVPLLRQNALELIVKCLGPATRTNNVPDADKQLLAYAFDADGLIVYSPGGMEVNSVVLDFSGGDSAIRSRKPFPGSLRVLGKPVDQHLTASDLLAHRKLNLSSKKDGFIQGRVAGLELVFMTSASGLDCLVIDLE